MYMYTHANTLNSMHACAHFIHTHIYACHNSYAACNDASDQVWREKKIADAVSINFSFAQTRIRKIIQRPLSIKAASNVQGTEPAVAS